MFRLIKIFATLLIIILLVIFAAINTQVVTLYFFFWRVDASLALFLIITFLLGWTIGAFTPILRNRKKVN